MTDSQFSQSPHTPQILTPEFGSSNGSGDISAEDYIKTVPNKHPVSRDRITAESAAAKELGTLFRNTQDKLMALKLNMIQRSHSTTTKAQVSSEGAHEYNRQDGSLLPLLPLVFDIPGEERTGSVGDDPVRPHNIAKQSDNHSAKAAKQNSGFGISRTLWGCSLQTLLRTSSDMGDTTSSSSPWMPESYCTPNTSSGGPASEIGGLCDEGLKSSLTRDFEDPFTADQTDLQRSHFCDRLGFASSPRENVFGCADTEVRVVYDSESSGCTSLWVCGERMKSVSHKWASSRSLRQYTTRMPFTVVVNSSNYDIIDAARYLFCLIHASGSSYLPAMMRSDVLSRMVAISNELKCEPVISSLVQRFLSFFAEQTLECPSECDFHYAIYLAKQFRHDTSFRMATWSLATMFPRQKGNPSLALWADKITEPFVHIAIVPVLQAINEVCSHAMQKIIPQIESLLMGYQCDAGEEELPAIQTLLEDNLAGARRRLRRGLVSIGLWPLNKPYYFSLRSFVDDIKDAGELDLDYAGYRVSGPLAECDILAELYGMLDNIVNDNEFSVYCF